MVFDVHKLVKIPRMAISRIQSHEARGFEIKITNERLVELIFEGLGNGCFLCGGDMDIIILGDGQHPPDNMLTLDVLNPDRRVLDEDNIRMVCCSCNQMKGNMSFDDFLWRCTMISERGLVGGK